MSGRTHSFLTCSSKIFGWIGIFFSFLLILLLSFILSDSGFVGGYDLLRAHGQICP